MKFSEIIRSYDWEEIRQSIYSKSEKDVRLALQAEKCGLENFKALISPAADAYLEEMASKSRQITLKRFGNTIQLFIPLYLSNECTNHCVYCGFNHANEIERKTLTDKEILDEIKVLKSYGFEHILLVTGESVSKCGFEYIKHAFELIRPHFSLISMEVQPLEENQYRELMELGLHTVYVYQETYNVGKYKVYHPKGKKSDFDYRMETTARLGRAGVYKTGIGFLIGLEDWRTEAYFNALHLAYLEKNFWKTKYSISFPRLRPHTGMFNPDYPVSDRNLVQMITAYRIFNENVELSISVRESEKFRNNIMRLGITSMSAGSKTEPGGYTSSNGALEQFAVHDDRSPSEFADVIRSQGYEPVWKDWDSSLQ